MPLFDIQFFFMVNKIACNNKKKHTEKQRRSSYSMKFIMFNFIKCTFLVKHTLKKKNVPQLLLLLVHSFKSNDVWCCKLVRKKLTFIKKPTCINYLQKRIVQHFFLFFKMYILNKNINENIVTYHKCVQWALRCYVNQPQIQSFQRE